MRRGCIAICELSCDGCARAIKHEERYLVVDEEGNSNVRLCVNCSLDRGYASYRKEKGENALTFWP